MNFYKVFWTIFHLSFFITNVYAQPSNDDPCSAIALTVNSSCSFSTYTNASATASSGVPAPGCASYSGGDVWFTITVPANGNITVDTDTGVITDAGMAIYSGTCGSLTLIECDDDDSGNGAMSYISLTGQTPGSTLWIRVWEYGNNNNGTFDICAYNPPSLSNDDPCSATNLTVGSTCSFNTYTNAGATASSGVPAPGCANYSGGDVWFTATVPTSGSIIFDMNTGVITDAGMAVYSGTCSSLTLVECDDDDSGNGAMSYISLTGQTPGSTLWIRVWEYGNDNNGTFDICSYEPAPPGACTGDMTINSTYFSQTGLTTCGFGDDYSSSDACGSSYMDGDDIVIEYTPTTTECIQIALSNTDTYVGIFLTNGCPDDPGTTCLSSATNSSGNPILSGYTVTAGTTYYLTISTYPSPQCTPFDIEISACPPPPANDECSNATVITETPITSTCSPVSGTVSAATTSSQANDCSGTADDDVWYQFVATSTDVQIDLSSISGTVSDMYFSVYGGSCGSPGSALLCSDPNSGQVNGLTIGNTYYIRVYTYTSTGGQAVNFNICVSEIGPCGISSQTEDYCPYPATLTQGPGSWTSTTYDYYTEDTPGNSGTVFCGSVENNSWYQFTALSTTETFNITDVSSCVNDWGVQMQVYDVTYDGTGCCSSFTSMSNCYNPGDLTLGTVTATGLTIGNQYLLMVDGNAGDNCAFTISGWTATNIILPVELVDFSVVSRESENVLLWKTATEKNNDYFSIERSFEGESFIEIGKVKGAGNSQDPINYYFSDQDVRNGKVYYRLVQYDVDGQFQTSETISLNREMTTPGIQSVYPNPTEGAVFVEINTEKLNGNTTLYLMTLDGKVISEEHLYDIKGLTIRQLKTDNLSKGMYLIKLSDDSGFEQVQKLVKK